MIEPTACHMCENLYCLCCYSVALDKCPKCGTPTPIPGDYEPLRAAFEVDAETLGFDLTRAHNPNVEPWDDYVDQQTGHRWGGWIAAHDMIRRDAA